MSTAVATTRAPTPVEAYSGQVMGDEGRRAELFGSLPSHIPPERFQRNLLNLLMQRPEIMKYDARLVYREVSKAAALGLLLDPQLGEAYVVPVWNGKLKRQEPQLRVSYRGLIKLARQSGEIRRIYAREVCAADHLECEQGTNEYLVHRPQLFGDRGEVVGYYAVAHFADGTCEFEPMSMKDLRRIRDEKSDNWRAFKDGKIASSPWQTDEGEMCKKTVIRRLLKRVPQSPDLADVLAHENGEDEGERRGQLTTMPIAPAVQPQAQPRTITASLDAFAEADNEPPVDEQIAASPPEGSDEARADDAGEPASLASPPATDGEAGEISVEASARLAGAQAFEDGRRRSVPAKIRQEGASAAESWLAGYDQAANEAASADAGAV